MASLGQTTIKNSTASEAKRDAKADNMTTRGESKVVILYTGGTIGMVDHGKGYEPEENFFPDLIRRNARFNDIKEHKLRVDKGDMEITSFITPVTLYGTRIIYDFVELSPLIDSSNMDIDKWM